MKYGMAVILTLGVITTSWASDGAQLADTDVDKKDTTSHQAVVIDPLTRINSEISFYDEQLRAVPTEGNPVVNQILEDRFKKGQAAFTKLRDAYLKDPQMNVSAAIAEICNSPVYAASR